METVCIVEDNKGSKLPHSLAIGDLKRLNDVERTVGRNRVAVDVFDIRRDQSGRNSVDREFNLAGSFKYRRSRLATDSVKCGVGIDSRDDLDLFYRHLAGLAVPKPKPIRYELAVAQSSNLS